MSKKRFINISTDKHKGEFYDSLFVTIEIGKLDLSFGLSYTHNRYYKNMR